MRLKIKLAGGAKTLSGYCPTTSEKSRDPDVDASRHCGDGLILGPLAEQQFRRALSISQGDLSVFFTHPISLALLIIAALLVVVPIFLRRRRAKAEPAIMAP